MNKHKELRYTELKPTEENVGDITVEQLRDVQAKEYAVYRMAVDSIYDILAYLRTTGHSLSESELNELTLLNDIKKAFTER